MDADSFPSPAGVDAPRRGAAEPWPPAAAHYCIWCWSTSVVRTLPEPRGLLGTFLSLLGRKHYTCRDCRRWLFDVPLVRGD